ncbi:MAG: hydrogenase expression/formation protein HupK [Dinoroseobacter sp.]|nr:hydrogenase expression/formation protein HupK [Dinoroseobacter sp.]
MLDATSSFVVDPTPTLPVDAMVRGKTCAEVAELLPRLFNLCKTAQETAARLAFGLPVPDTAEALSREIVRDHVLRLSLVLPGHFGQAPPTLPIGWQQGGDKVRDLLFGPTGILPERPDDLGSYMMGTTLVGALWGRFRDMFAPGEAVCAALPTVTSETAAKPNAAVENSVALRSAQHPVVKALEHTFGRGPLWRVVGRSYDLQARLDGEPLLISNPRPGLTHVAATRGLYTISAEVADGHVVSLSRVTPTDHLRAPDGMLAQTLASLPVDRAGLLPLLMDVLDPCMPLRVREVADA